MGGGGGTLLFGSTTDTGRVRDGATWVLVLDTPFPHSRVPFTTALPYLDMEGSHTTSIILLDEAGVESAGDRTSRRKIYPKEGANMLAGVSD